jgi:putative Ca2+/H+ antiporter (TMEM165/GDT1 family)
MEWPLFFSTFALISLAELPDKTIFATVLLASRENPRAVFLGVAGAFAIQSLVAVLFGSVLAIFPEKFVRVAAGLLFLVFALMIWREQGEKEAEKNENTVEKSKSFWRVAGSAFLVIFIAEWGDLTQLATATLAAGHHAPVTIYLSATLALWSVTAAAVFLGNKAKRLIHPPALQKIGAVVFAAAGIIFLIRAFYYH